jgi:predicted transcriptional regulator
MLGDLLFELSNDDRRRILLSIQKKPMRLTQISKNLDLTIQETSRQLSRLEDVGLEYKDSKGFHNLTNLGELILRQLRGIEFTSIFNTYFMSHTVNQLSDEIIDGIGDLSDCIEISNPMDFIYSTENLIKDARKFVCLIVDQFPINSLSAIVEALDRGVKINLIEHRERVLNPDLNILTSEETQTINRTRHTPLVEQRMLEEINLYMLVSESCCIIAFPNSEGEFDFKGFTATGNSSIRYCKKIFHYYWESAEERIKVPIISFERAQTPRKAVGESGLIVVVGQDNPEIDAQSVQDAVDNYNEVTLKGVFNFGTSMVQISRSIVIKGEGRENDIPKTTLYKKGWKFPFTAWDYIFLVSGEGADVRIENLRFTDFDCSCIGGRLGNSFSIVDNRITVPTGYGRGMTYGAFGDMILGIHVEGQHSFSGGVIVEGNYIDFAPGPIWGGHVSRGGLEEDPEYRPKMINHEYYMGYGIAVNSVYGDVKIENNIVRNVNGRGIATEGHLASTKANIRCNTVLSDVYGSYPFSSKEAGSGILAQSVLSTSGSGFNVLIENNTIKLDKINYSGIVVLGPATSREGAEKLKGGVIRKNIIQLKNGSEGIHVRKCDDFKVTENTLTGKMYYGIRISGRKKPGELDLRAFNNRIENNHMKDLMVKEPDKYCTNHQDGRMFSYSDKLTTSNVWMDRFSENNTVKIKKGETVINEGENNIIIFE